MQDRFWVVLLTPLLGNSYINHFYRSMSDSTDVEQCHGLLLFYHIKFQISHLSSDLDFEPVLPQYQFSHEQFIVQDA